MRSAGVEKPISIRRDECRGGGCDLRTFCGGIQYARALYPAQDACAFPSPQAGELEFCVELFAPHLFALTINAAFSRFATRYAVNLGAGDGVSCNDPVYPLYQAGYAGLAVEGGDDPALEANLPSPNVCKLLGTVITPANAAALLESAGCPQSPDLLKVDLDGYDGPVLLEILKAGYRPKVIQAEVQPEVPPPLEFAVLYDPAYRCLGPTGRHGGFYGASLSYVANLGRRFGYFAAQLDFVTPFTHDVTLIREDYADLVLGRFGIARRPDRELFLAHPPGYSHFREDDGIDAAGWRHAPDPHALVKGVWAACVASCVAKHGGLLPFHLGVS